MPGADNRFVNFCNNLRCPLCGCQLDGSIGKFEAHLYCVSNNDEYRCTALERDMEIVDERICFWYSQWAYVFFNYKEHVGNKEYCGNWQCIISKINLDNHPRYRKEELIIELQAKIPKIFRSRLEEKELLKKLKLYMVFS